MSALAFTWDPVKAATNLRKHGVSFDEATSVFTNPLARVLPDPTRHEDEDRAIIVGYSERGRLLLIVFMERAGRLRIISARPVSARAWRV
jgi:uncharacterized DUF497 family protein